MDLELTDDQQTLRDNIRAVLAEECDPALVREVTEGRSDGSTLWKTMVDLGWPALGVPESAGGLGFGAVELSLLAEELGRAAAPGPLLATATQFAPLLVELGVLDSLTSVADGSQTGALALAERGMWTTTAIQASARQAETGWLLSGRKSAVLGGALADTVAVVARDEASGRLGAWLVKRADVEVAACGELDPGLALADLVFDGTTGELIGEPGAATEAAIERVLEQAAVAMALHTVGACRRIFEVTLDYSKVRVQYDQLIGSFQALKHRFADLYLAVERATAVGYFAAVALAEDDTRRTEAAHLAKAAAGDCQRLVVEDGLQLHGGIGYTWENDLHFHLKRAKAGEMLCGSSASHRAALAVSLGLVEGALS